MPNFCVATFLRQILGYCGVMRCARFVIVAAAFGLFLPFGTLVFAGCPSASSCPKDGNPGWLTGATRKYNDEVVAVQFTDGPHTWWEDCATASYKQASLQKSAPPVVATKLSDRSDSVQKQWAQVQSRIGVLEFNIVTWMLDATDRGVINISAWKDSSESRQAAWNPKLPPSAANVTSVNDGRGCVHLISTKDAPYDGPPDICAPLKLQMELTMAELHENSENLSRLPENKDDDGLVLLRDMLSDVYDEWKITRTMYCLLYPSASYVDIDQSKVKACTPSRLVNANQ